MPKMEMNVYLGRKKSGNMILKDGQKCLIGDEVKTESTREEEVMEHIEVESQWEADETVQEKHDPSVEGKEAKPTREESNDEHERLSVEPREINIEPSGDDNHVKENHEFSVEPRKQKIWVSKMIMRLSKWR